MRAFFLNEDFISACFWSATQSFIDSRPAVYHQIDEIISATESIRKNFPFGQAGSISRDSALELLSIAAYFSPKSVCEVGTYIGVQLFVLSLGRRLLLIVFLLATFHLITFRCLQKYWRPVHSETLSLISGKSLLLKCLKSFLVVGALVQLIFS